MLYINPEGEYPRYYGDIMAANPGWKLGDPLPEGWQEVKDIDPPTPQEDKVIEDGYPEFIDGVLTRVFVVRDFTPEEIEAKQAILNLKQKINDLGLTQTELEAIKSGLV